MDSMIWLALSLPITALVLTLSLWLILRWMTQDRAATRAATMEHSRLNANLQATQMKVQLESLTQLSEDTRSTSMAVLTGMRESVSKVQTMQQSMSETFRMQQAQLLRAQQEGTATLEQFLTRQATSQTSLLRTLVTLLGTKDSLAFAQVNAAASSASSLQEGQAPYTTGDEEAEAVLQKIIDDYRGLVPGGDDNGSSFFESGQDLRDFGVL